ncbi:MAG: hypothetical protein AB7P12_01025 [Alphaproteobacteria bacterium]
MRRTFHDDPPCVLRVIIRDPVGMLVRRTGGYQSRNRSDFGSVLSDVLLGNIREVKALTQARMVPQMQANPIRLFGAFSRMRKIAREEHMENFYYRRCVATLAVAFAVAGGAWSAQADASADFYKSKGLRLVVGYGPGGGYDTYGRFLARHWGRHLPGNPNIIVVNMPGAGSRKATDHIYNAAPKDGSVVGLASKAIPGYQLFGGSGARWDSLKLSWIGRLDGGNGVMYMWHGSGINGIGDAKKKVVRVGATSRTTDSYFYPVIANAYLNTRFKVITGYTGGSKSLDLAMERGEIDGRGGNTWASTKSRNSDWLRDGKMKIIFQVGIEKEPDLPNVPLLRDLITDDDARSVLSVIELPTFTGYSIMGPPALPPDRLEALRAGFNAAMKDPALIADAKKLDLSLSPATGEKIDQTLAEIAAKISPATKAEVAKILGWNEKKKKKK